MDPATQPKHLIYIADPMCSWSYGFAPVIAAIADSFQERLPLAVVMGGLRAGHTKAMTADDRETIKGHWERVEQRTGQAFDYSFFDRPVFVYDTEPACRAVVTMRLLNPPLAFPYLARIQHAFYALGQDTTKAATLVAIAGEMGLDEQAFLRELGSAEARNATIQDFVIAQRSGITGFPALLAGPTPDGYAVVTQGYRPLDGIEGALELWLAEAEPQH